MIANWLFGRQRGSFTGADRNVKGEVHPSDAPKPIKTDVRVIAPTNRNLEANVQSGRFRDDLYWRLNVSRTHIPPLRERREDIPYSPTF